MASSVFHLTSAASVNLTQLGNGHTELYGLKAVNLNTSPAYVKFYWGAPGGFKSSIGFAGAPLFGAVLSWENPDGTVYDFGVGDGTTTVFPVYNPGPSIYKSDWQGNQLQYSTPRTQLVPYASIPNQWALNTTNTGWGTASSVTPSGSGNSYPLIPTTVSANHFTILIFSTSFNAGTYTVFADVAPDGYDFALLVTGAPSGNAWGNTYNLSTGALDTAGFTGGTGITFIASSILPLPNGFYRISNTFSIPITTTLSIQLWVQNATGGAATYAGNGTSGILVAEGQCIVGTLETSFIPNTTSAPVTVTDYSLVNGGDNPTVGVDIPAITVEVPASGNVDISFPEIISGLGNLFMATTMNPGDTDSTAVPAGDLILSVLIG